MSIAAEDEFARYQARVRGTNISEQTLLATDYLNHFNEIVMLLEMVPDIPECFEDAQEWTPKSYPQHFIDSGFTEGELAVEAYQHVPACYRRPFDDTVETMNGLVSATLEQIETSLAGGDEAATRSTVDAFSTDMHKLIETASAIINGHAGSLEQDQIDSLLDG